MIPRNYNKNVVQLILKGILYLILIVLGILSVIIHVWTIIIAFFSSGFLAAILTFSFPILSEIYWFFDIGEKIGYGSLYCKTIIGFVVLFMILFIVVTINEKIEQED